MACHGMCRKIRCGAGAGWRMQQRSRRACGRVRRAAHGPAPAVGGVAQEPESHAKTATIMPCVAAHACLRRCSCGASRATAHAALPAVPRAPARATPAPDSRLGMFQPASRVRLSWSVPLLKFGRAPLATPLHATCPAVPCRALPARRLACAAPSLRFPAAVGIVSPLCSGLPAVPQCHSSCESPVALCTAPSFPAPCLLRALLPLPLAA